MTAALTPTPRSDDVYEARGDERRGLRSADIVVAVTVLGGILRVATVNTQSIWLDEAVVVGSAGGAEAARASRLAWFPPAADIEPCMRFSRTRLPDVLHRWAFSVPVATAGWGVARRWFR